WLFRSQRPSDGHWRDYTLDGDSGDIWHTGKLRWNPAGYPEILNPNGQWVPFDLNAGLGTERFVSNRPMTSTTTMQWVSLVDINGTLGRINKLGINVNGAARNSASGGELVVGIRITIDEMVDIRTDSTAGYSDSGDYIWEIN